MSAVRVLAGYLLIDTQREVPPVVGQAVLSVNAFIHGEAEEPVSCTRCISCTGTWSLEPPLLPSAFIYIVIDDEDHSAALFCHECVEDHKLEELVNEALRARNLSPTVLTGDMEGSA